VKKKDKEGRSSKKGKNEERRTSARPDNVRDEYERIILYISFYFKSKRKINENNKQ
jgi:hypothetical protein